MPQNNNQNNSQNNGQPKPFKAVIWIFAAFFSTFIIVDICYMTIAEKTWRGLATDDGYEKGLKYNQTILAVENQKKLGWDLQIKYYPSAIREGQLQIKLFDRNNKIINDAKLLANIKRPVQEGHDFSVDLKFDSQTSSYNSKINFPLIGQWDVEIVANKNDDVYQSVKRLVIR